MKPLPEDLLSYLVHQQMFIQVLFKTIFLVKEIIGNFLSSAKRLVLST